MIIVSKSYAILTIFNNFHLNNMTFSQKQTIKNEKQLKILYKNIK